MSEPGDGHGPAHTGQEAMDDTINKSKKYGSHTAPSYSYSLSVCQIW